MARRPIFRDPEPLPWDAPEFLDEESAAFYAKEQLNAVLKMAQFDRQPTVVRRVEHAVGKLPIAQMLVRQGVRTPEEAEPIVRAMLEKRQGIG
jgi:hypothetical protein